MHNRFFYITDLLRWIRRHVKDYHFSKELDILLDLKELLKKEDLVVVGVFEDEERPLFEQYMIAGEQA